MNDHISPLSGTRQFGSHGPVIRRCVSILLMFVLGFGVGCNSIYHRTRASLPPEPCAQVKYRVEEAQRAEKLAQQAITTLRERLNQGLSGAAVETDVDRVEIGAFELERKVASAQDAAAHCEGETQLASEIERLQRRASKLRESVQAVRRGDNSFSPRELDEFLNGAAKP
jgi:hypothetical protein